MISKIISGGQTGADQGALDAAIKLGIPHGGWIPKGRLTEAGPLPPEYDLIEMPTAAYNARTEKNVFESDGTLILTHGKLSGGSLLKKHLADMHGKPCLHIDLADRRLVEVGGEAYAWVVEYGIEVLNVAGSRASKDPLIYRDTFSVVQSILYLSKIGAPVGATLNDYTQDQLIAAFLVPKTVDEAVDVLLQRLGADAREQIHNFAEGDLSILHEKIGTYTRNEFSLWDWNKELMDDCCRLAGLERMRQDQASELIVRKLWEFLRQRKH